MLQMTEGKKWKLIQFSKKIHTLLKQYIFTNQRWQSTVFLFWIKKHRGSSPLTSKDDSNTNNNQKFCLLPGLLASASSPSASEQSFCCNTCAKNLICVALRCFRSPYTTTVFSHPFHFSNQLFREFTWSRNMVLDFILELSFLFKCCLYLSILFFEFYYLAVPALNLIKKQTFKTRISKHSYVQPFHFSMNIVICQFKKKHKNY